LQKIGLIGDNEGGPAKFDEPFALKIGEQSTYSLAGGTK
jgi:hypothetical protein